MGEAVAHVLSADLVKHNRGGFKGPRGDRGDRGDRGGLGLGSGRTC